MNPPGTFLGSGMSPGDLIHPHSTCPVRASFSQQLPQYLRDTRARLVAPASLGYTGSHIGQTLLGEVGDRQCPQHWLAPEQHKEVSNGSIASSPWRGVEHPSFHMGLGRVAHLPSLGSKSTGISLRSRWALSSLLKTTTASLKTKNHYLQGTGHPSSLASTSPAGWTGETCTLE